MTRIHMAPGATVMSTPTHGGLERVSRGTTVLTALLMQAIRALDGWRNARIEAHNAARMMELAAHDPRVLADLRAARDRAMG